MIRLAPPDLKTAAPFAAVGAAALALIAVAADTPALAPVGALAGAATAIGLYQARGTPLTGVALAAPSLLASILILSDRVGAMGWVAVVGFAAGALAGHPAIFLLVVLTSAPVFLVGWGVPIVYLAGCGYGSVVRKAVTQL